MSPSMRRLNAPLRFKAGEHVKAVMIELLPNEYEPLRSSLDDLRYGGCLSIRWWYRLADDVRSDPRPGGQGYRAHLGLRSLRAARWTFVGRGEGRIRASGC